jgi:hypothetical protein
LLLLSVRFSSSPCYLLVSPHRHQLHINNKYSSIVAVVVRLAMKDIIATHRSQTPVNAEGGANFVTSIEGTSTQEITLKTFCDSVEHNQQFWSGWIGCLHRRWCYCFLLTASRAMEYDDVPLFRFEAVCFKSLSRAIGRM